jgi:hypothetical protein
MSELFKDVPYEIGDEVTYIGRDSYGVLRPGDRCVVTNIQHGTFPKDYYTSVKVIDTENRALAYHWRFKK